jgi:hypothetical protein
MEVMDLRVNGYGYGTMAMAKFTETKGKDE